MKILKILEYLDRPALVVDALEGVQSVEFDPDAVVAAHQPQDVVRKDHVR